MAPGGLGLTVNGWWCHHDIRDVPPHPLEWNIKP